MENDNYKAIASSPEEQLHNNTQQAVEDEMDEDSAAKEKLTSTDPTKVVFLSANSEYTRKNGDAKVDIENVQRSIGMGKEELLKYANEPFWVRLRMTLFVLFWLVWIAMLIGSVAIIALVPGCPASPKLEWWQKTTVYQVMVNSFKDSDNDRTGDLKGLTDKMDYFSNIKVDSILLSSIFASDSQKFPSGVTNFTEIAPLYGNFTIFDSLIEKADTKGIKVLLEFIPNHTSEECDWFKKSVRGEEPYDKYYIWKKSKPGSGEPGHVPDDRKNVYGKPAWTWNENRKMYYFHQFHSGLPDLNLRNKNLRQEFKEILKFWLDRGVDGFKVMDVDFQFEDTVYHDETDEKPQVNQTENLKLLREWRDTINLYVASSPEKHPRILLTETATDSEASFEYYGQSDNPVVDIPYNLGLTALTNDSTPKKLKEVLQQSFNNTPTGLWPNFVLGTSRHPRLLSRVGSALLDGIHMVALLSNGTPVVFFGDELGMEGGAQIVDSQDKQPEENLLMQWSNTTSNIVSVDVEMTSPHSHLSIFKHLLSLREKPAISFGATEFPLVDNDTFSMMRVKKGTPGYLVVINFSSNQTVVNFSGKSDLLPEIATVELAVPRNDTEKGLSEKNQQVPLSEVKLAPHQSAVLTFVPKG